MKKTYYRKGTPQRLQVIGVAGAFQGCGVTHFVWSAANYLSNVKGRRTVVCNFSKEQDYRQAKVILCGNKKETDLRFSYAGITFLVQADETMLAGLSGSFDYALLDLGCDKERYKDILLWCDRRFLLGALNQWRGKAFVTTAIQLQELYAEGAVEFLAVFYSAEGKRSFEAALDDRVQLLPYEPEPFLLHRESLRRMEAIFSQTD